MSDQIPRLRMFAGPNGSGKTTVKTNLQKPNNWFGVYLNSDDLEAAVRNAGQLAVESFGFTPDPAKLRDYFAQSKLLQRHRLGIPAGQIKLSEDNLFLQLPSDNFTSYHASVLSDFLRNELIAAKRPFSFETVMSHPSKTDLLQRAKEADYKTYLYYIGTEDVRTNIQRVKNRVSDGGHPVPEDKIRERYIRSLDLLPSAIRQCSRAFLFDNSGEKPLYFAQIEEGVTLHFLSDEIPRWFEPILDELQKG